MQTYTVDELTIRKREPLLDYTEHYDFVVPSAIETYDLVAQGIALNGDNPEFPKAAAMTATRRRAWDALDHLCMAYSAGNPLDELKDFYPTVLEYWEVYAKYDRLFDDSPEAHDRVAAGAQGSRRRNGRHPRWAKATARRRKWRIGLVRICHRRRREYLNCC